MVLKVLRIQYEFVKSVPIELKNSTILAGLELGRHSIIFLECEQSINDLFNEFIIVAALDMVPMGYAHLLQRYQFLCDYRIKFSYAKFMIENQFYWG